MTWAQTDVIRVGNYVYVYFNGKYAYDINRRTLTKEQKTKLKQFEKNQSWPDTKAAQEVSALMDGEPWQIKYNRANQSLKAALM